MPQYPEKPKYPHSGKGLGFRLSGLCIHSTYSQGTYGAGDVVSKHTVLLPSNTGEGQYSKLQGFTAQRTSRLFAPVLTGPSEKIPTSSLANLCGNVAP